MERRSFLKATFAAAAAGVLGRSQTVPPNVIVILADDLGYGDLGCYGSDLATPNLDAMAAGGARFDHFYSASPVCSPSRAALLTGRYPTRVGVPTVLGPSDTGGLSLSETTLPQLLKQKNYNTMCIGKWHLGCQPDYMPNNRGFDQFYGLPYSNDMSPLPLMRNTDVLEPSARLDTLTSDYTAEALNFIRSSNGNPFFLYLAHTFPHVPLAASRRFRGKSGFGMYGDCIQEIDWSTGQILAALKANNVDDNTLVIFTSDNGPWFLGSPGRLRGRKGETFEGGMREPFLARWPARIPAGRQVKSMATMLDILPTVARITGAPMPAKPGDGVDISPVLTGDQDSVDRPPFFYFDGWNLQCARVGQWKLHVSRYNTPPWVPSPDEGRLNLPLRPPELYDVAQDTQESYNCADDNPDLVNDIRSRIVAALPSFPADVQNAWQDTMNQPTDGNWDGGFPVKHK